MKMNQKIKDRCTAIISLWVVGIIILQLGMSLSGCVGTVTPVSRPQTTQPSFDDLGQSTSGIIFQLSDHSAVITEAAWAEYEGLVAKYGKDPKFVPALKHGEGVKEVTGLYAGKPVYQIDAQHLTYYIIMHEWNQLGRPLP